LPTTQVFTASKQTFWECCSTPDVWFAGCMLTCLRCSAGTTICTLTYARMPGLNPRSSTWWRHTGSWATNGQTLRAGCQVRNAALTGFVLEHGHLLSWSFQACEADRWWQACGSGRLCNPQGDTFYTKAMPQAPSSTFVTQNLVMHKPHLFLHKLQTERRKAWAALPTQCRGSFICQQCETACPGQLSITSWACLPCFQAALRML
jgi:hypothetical protein